MEQETLDSALASKMRELLAEISIAPPTVNQFMSLFEAKITPLYQSFLYSIYEHASKIMHAPGAKALRRKTTGLFPPNHTIGASIDYLLANEAEITPQTLPVDVYLATILAKHDTPEDETELVRLAKQEEQLLELKPLEDQLRLAQTETAKKEVRKQIDKVKEYYSIVLRADTPKWRTEKINDTARTINHVIREHEQTFFPHEEPMGTIFGVWYVTPITQLSLEGLTHGRSQPQLKKESYSTANRRIFNYPDVIFFASGRSIKPLNLYIESVSVQIVAKAHDRIGNGLEVFAATEKVQAETALPILVERMSEAASASLSEANSMMRQWQVQYHRAGELAEHPKQKKGARAKTSLKSIPAYKRLFEPYKALTHVIHAMQWMNGDLIEDEDEEKQEIKRRDFRDGIESIIRGDDMEHYQVLIDRNLSSLSRMLGVQAETAERCARASALYQRHGKDSRKRYKAIGIYERYDREAEAYMQTPDARRLQPSRDRTDPVYNSTLAKLHALETDIPHEDIRKLKKDYSWQMRTLLVFKHYCLEYKHRIDSFVTQWQAYKRGETDQIPDVQELRFVIDDTPSVAEKAERRWEK